MEFVTSPPPQEDPGNYCRFDGVALTRPHSVSPPDALTCYVHDSFRSLVLNKRFSCVGARAAVRHNAYGFGLYPGMGTLEASAALACDLRRFIADQDLAEKSLTAFAASFVAPVPVDEEHFEELLWRTLQLLSDADAAPWAANRAADPADPRFAFSLGGTAFFIVGLHAGSSRVSRRFAWPTIVFNPHDQFDRLRLDGKYSRFQKVIRAAEIALQGNSNPMLSDFGEQSEARQYSGRFVDASWKCPFHARHNAGPAGGEE